MWLNSSLTETLAPIECPNCGIHDIAHTSPHMLFHQDRMAFRCRSCKHIWDLPNSEIDNYSASTKRMNERRAEITDFNRERLA
jgi:hypothetical protein